MPIIGHRRAHLEGTLDSNAAFRALRVGRRSLSYARMAGFGAASAQSAGDAHFRCGSPVAHVRSLGAAERRCRSKNAETGIHTESAGFDREHLEFARRRTR